MYGRWTECGSTYCVDGLIGTIEEDFPLGEVLLIEVDLHACRGVLLALGILLAKGLIRSGSGVA